LMFNIVRMLSLLRGTAKRSVALGIGGFESPPDWF
jgi:hypothetical protein